MPRNRFTKSIHKEQRAQIAYQEKELVLLARGLRRHPTEVVELPVVIDLKHHRRVRLEQKHRHKPAPEQAKLSA